MKTYKANVESQFNWLIPYILGVSKTLNNEKHFTYSINVTPFIEITVGKLGSKSGYKLIK